MAASQQCLHGACSFEHSRTRAHHHQLSSVSIPSWSEPGLVQLSCNKRSSKCLYDPANALVQAWRLRYSHGQLRTAHLRAAWLWNVCLQLQVPFKPGNYGIMMQGRAWTPLSMRRRGVPGPACSSCWQQAGLMPETLLNTLSTQIKAGVQNCNTQDLSTLTTEELQDGLRRTLDLRSKPLTLDNPTKLVVQQHAFERELALRQKSDTWLQRVCPRSAAFVAQVSLPMLRSSFSSCLWFYYQP